MRNYIASPKKMASFRVAEEAWVQQANCQGVDTNLFFPERIETGGDDSDYAAAREVCRHCPVQSECLEYALRTRQIHGLWGGKSERERRRIRRQMTLARGGRI